MKKVHATSTQFVKILIARLNKYIKTQDGLVIRHPSITFTEKRLFRLNFSTRSLADLEIQKATCIRNILGFFFK